MLLLFKISFTALFATDRTHPDSVLWCWSCQLMLHLYKRREHDRRICFLYCLCVAVLTRVSFTAFLFFWGWPILGKVLFSSGNMSLNPYYWPYYSGQNVLILTKTCVSIASYCGLSLTAKPFFPIGPMLCEHISISSSAVDKSTRHRTVSSPLFIQRRCDVLSSLSHIPVRYQRVAVSTLGPEESKTEIIF